MLRCTLIRNNGVLRLARCKSYSTQTRVHPSITVYMDKTSKRQNNLLAPSKEFPFNGHVTSAIVYLGQVSTKDIKQPPKTTKLSEDQVKPLSLSQLMDEVSQSAKRSHDYEPKEQLNDFNFLFDDEVITIDTVECPRLLKNELHKVFKKTDPKLFRSHITVINILQQESTTFEEVSAEEKMDAKMVYFIETADSICETLNRSGYWADYIDPHSGRPRRSPTEAAERLLNPDQTKQQLGYNLEEFKQCMKISNVSFDNQTYIGSIFTNAPVEEANVTGFVDALNGSDDAREA